MYIILIDIRYMNDGGHRMGVLYSKRESCCGTGRRAFDGHGLVPLSPTQPFSLMSDSHIYR